jgi:hypothetical protein
VGEHSRIKEGMISKSAWEGKVKGRGPDDLQGDKFGGLNTVVDAIIRIPELRAGS